MARIRVTCGFHHLTVIAHGQPQQLQHLTPELAHVQTQHGSSLRCRTGEPRDLHR